MPRRPTEISAVYHSLDGVFVQAHGPADAPLVVLVHGSPDRSSTFGALLPLLSDLQVITFDRRGFGRSADAAPPTSLHDHALDLIALLENLGVPCAVAAHSFGSNVVMLAASLRPDLFSAVGLWEPPTVWIESWPSSTKEYHQRVADSPDPAGMIEEIFRALLGADTWEALPAAVRQQRRAEGPAFQVDMVSVIAAPFDVADVHVPAIVGYGTETSGGHVEGAIWLAEHLADASLHAVPAVGHFAPRTHPERFAEFVRMVMSRADGATSTTTCRTTP